MDKYRNKRNDYNLDKEDDDCSLDPYDQLHYRNENDDFDNSKGVEIEHNEQQYTSQDHLASRKRQNTDNIVQMQTDKKLVTGISYSFKV